jgi:hypothetical protein
MSKLSNPNRVKIHHSYTVGEIAELYCVHKNTVRAWVKGGLPTIDKKRPHLILGSDLKQHLRSKRKKSKRKCLPYEIYCVRCRLPQIPAMNMVDFKPINSSMGCLIGLCPSCEGIINKFCNVDNLEKIKGKLDITFTKALEHINESDNPPVNSDYNK